jgi:hypothetical protein
MVNKVMWQDTKLKGHFISVVMLELVTSLKVVSGRQHAQAVCPTVKYCHYILERGKKVVYHLRSISKNEITSCPECSAVFKDAPTGDCIQCL